MWLLWKCKFGRVIIPVCVTGMKKNGFKLVHTVSHAWLQNHFSALSASVIFSHVVITIFCPPLLKANVIPVISCFYSDYPLSFKARAIFHPHSILVVFIPLLTSCYFSIHIPNLRTSLFHPTIKGWISNPCPTVPTGTLSVSFPWPDSDWKMQPKPPSSHHPFCPMIPRTYNLQKKSPLPCFTSTTYECKHSIRDIYSQGSGVPWSFRLKDDCSQLCNGWPAS